LEQRLPRDGSSSSIGTPLSSFSFFFFSPSLPVVVMMMMMMNAPSFKFFIYLKKWLPKVASFLFLCRFLLEKKSQDLKEVFCAKLS
jgi:predicted MFS family arabinose efflux permease